MNYFKPGDSLTLRSGQHVMFVAPMPDDGACLVGEEVGREDGEILRFVSFERHQIAAINGEPRTPGDRDRLNFLMPVISGGDDGDRRTLKLAAGLMKGLIGNELLDWAIAQTPDFHY